MSEPTTDDLRALVPPDHQTFSIDGVAVADGIPVAALTWAADRIDELEQALHAEFDICNSLRAENEQLRRIHDVHLKGTLRIRGGWFWCERKNADGSWTMEFVKDPDFSAWGHVSPVLFDDGDDRATRVQETDQ